ERQKKYLFKKMLRKDKNIVLEDSCDELFRKNVVDQMGDCSLRDLQLLIDTAKIIYYGENFRDDCVYKYRRSCMSSGAPFVSTVLLTKKHFQQALAQLKSESLLTKESFFDSDSFTKRLQNGNNVLSLVISVLALATWTHGFSGKWFGLKGAAIHG